MIIAAIVIYILIAVAVERMFSATGHTPVSFIVGLLWLPMFLALGIYSLFSRWWE